MLHLVLLAALAASPTTGDLVVSADAPFALFVDGRQVNPGNLQQSWTAANLAPGRHDVRVDVWRSPFRGERLAQGFVDVPPGAQVRVKAEPNRLVVYETVNVLAPASSVMVAVPGASLTMQVPGLSAEVSVREEARYDDARYDDDRFEDRDDRRERRHHRRDRHHDHRPPAPQPMDSAQFGALLEAIDAEGFEDGKLGVLRTAAPSAFFTVGQVGQLVDQFAFSSGKVAVVETCKPRILDLQNAFQLYSHFTFDSDKAKVRRILGR